MFLFQFKNEIFFFLNIFKCTYQKNNQYYIHIMLFISNLALPHLFQQTKLFPMYLNINKRIYNFDQCKFAVYIVLYNKF